MNKFLILLFVVVKVSSTSAQCNESQNAGEIFKVEYEGLNFTIAFTVPKQCPATPFIVAKVQQGNQSKEYCQFWNDPGSGHCVSSTRSPECLCDTLQARSYVIKAFLSEGDDEGKDWTIKSQPDFHVFNISVHVALSRASVTSASVTLHTQTSPFSTEDTFSPVGTSPNPVSVPVVTEESAKSLTTLDSNIIMYSAMGGILLLVIVVSCAFGIILYRKVLSANPKPAEPNRPVEQQEVIELQQRPMGNQDGAGNRLSGLSFNSDAYQTIDESSSDDSCPVKRSLPVRVVHHCTPPSKPPVNSKVTSSLYTELESDYLNPVASQQEKGSLGAQQSDRKTPAMPEDHKITAISEVTASLCNESDYLNPVASKQDKQASVAQQSDRETTPAMPEDHKITAISEVTASLCNESDYLNPVASLKDKQASVAQQSDRETTPVMSLVQKITANSQVTASFCTESDYLNPVASKQDKQASVAQKNDRETTPVVSQEDQKITAISQVTASLCTESYLNPVASQQEKQASVAQKNDRETTPVVSQEDQKITAISQVTAGLCTESDYLNPVASQQEKQASVAQKNERETKPKDQGAVGGGWTSGTHSQHIPIPADPTFVAQHKQAPVKFKPCPGKIPFPSGVGGVRADGSSFPQPPLLPSRSRSIESLSAQGGSSAAAAREDPNTLTCPRVAGVHTTSSMGRFDRKPMPVPGVQTTSSMGRFDREAMSSSVPEFATDPEGYLEPRQCKATPPRVGRFDRQPMPVPGIQTTSSKGRFDREAMPSSVPKFAIDSDGYLEPRQCNVATPPRKARAVAGLTQRTALQDGDGAGLQGQGAARQAEGGHKRRDKKRDDASDEEETPDGYMRMKRRQVSVEEHAPF